MVGATYAAAGRTALTVTANGNAQVDTGQSKFGGASYLGDGTGDYLRVTGGTISIGTGDFTIEMWARHAAVNVSQMYMDCRPTNVNGAYPGIFFLDSNSRPYYYFNTDTRITANSAMSTNTWYHIAMVRSGGVTKMYINGTAQTTTYTNSDSISFSVAHIGASNDPTPSQSLNGHIDEVRISTSARYTANFTPATSAFVNDANTVFLMHADGTDASTVFTDDNTGSARTARTLTAQGNAQVDTAQSKFGGSALLCDGTGDYVISPAGTQWDFGTGSFTIEYFIRFNAINTLYTPICLRVAGGDIENGEWWCEITAAENKMYWGFKNQAGTQYYVNLALAGTAFATGQFYHIALVNNAGTAQMYVNGTATGATTALSGSFGRSQRDLNIGAYGGDYSLNGWMDEVRISNTARYTAGFTAPTAPFVNDSNTLLLMHADGADASTVFTDDNS